MIHKWLQTLPVGLLSRPTLDPSSFRTSTALLTLPLIPALKNKQKTLTMDITQEPRLQKELQFQSLSLSAWLHLQSILKGLGLQVQGPRWLSEVVAARCFLDQLVLARSNLNQEQLSEPGPQHSLCIRRLHPTSCIEYQEGLSQ
jgi:hypothetical protein